MNSIDTRSAKRRLSNEEARKRFLASPQGQQAMANHQISLGPKAIASARALAQTMRPERPLVRR